MFRCSNAVGQSTSSTAAEKERVRFFQPEDAEFTHAARQIGQQFFGIVDKVGKTFFQPASDFQSQGVAFKVLGLHVEPVNGHLVAQPSQPLRESESLVGRTRGNSLDIIEIAEVGDFHCLLRIACCNEIKVRKLVSFRKIFLVGKALRGPVKVRVPFTSSDFFRIFIP
jgi:hypothetical protein